MLTSQAQQLRHLLPGPRAHMLDLAQLLAPNLTEQPAQVAAAVPVDLADSTACAITRQSRERMLVSVLALSGFFPCVFSPMKRTRWLSRSSPGRGKPNAGLRWGLMLLCVSWANAGRPTRRSPPANDGAASRAPVQCRANAATGPEMLQDGSGCHLCILRPIRVRRRSVSRSLPSTSLSTLPRRERHQRSSSAASAREQDRRRRSCVDRWLRALAVPPFLFPAHRR